MMTEKLNEYMFSKSMNVLILKGAVVISLSAGSVIRMERV